MDISRLAGERQLEAEVLKGSGPKTLQTVQCGKRLRRSCMKQGKRSRNEKQHGRGVVRTVRKGRMSCGHTQKNYERKASNMTETGMFLRMASDVSSRYEMNERNTRRKKKNCWKRTGSKKTNCGRSSRITRCRGSQQKEGLIVLQKIRLWQMNQSNDAKPKNLENEREVLTVLVEELAGRKTKTI